MKSIKRELLITLQLLTKEVIVKDAILELEVEKGEEIGEVWVVVLVIFLMEMRVSMKEMIQI